MGGDNGGKRVKGFRNMYKGHMDKTKEGGIKDGKWGWLEWGKWRQLYLNNNKKCGKKSVK